MTPWTRHTVFALVGLCLLFAHDVHAQTIEKLLGDGQSRWVQFQIVDGRIRAQSPYFGRFRSTSRSVTGQRLAITVVGGVGVVRYDWKNDELEKVAQATETGEVRITESPKGDKGVYRSFTQPTRGRVTLEFGPEEGRTRIEADSVWHMMLEHPKESTDHMYPLLDVLRGGWRWEDRFENVKKALFRLAEAESTTDREQWKKLVDLLASDKFVERRRAERLLRGYGRAVLPYLQSLDQDKLDAEQRFRIKRIVLASYGGNDDTPGRVATWLVGDARVWAALMASENAERRRLATAQLSEVLGDKADFDPDADAATRGKQLEKLRKSLPE